LQTTNEFKRQNDISTLNLWTWSRFVKKFKLFPKVYTSKNASPTKISKLSENRLRNSETKPTKAYTIQTFLGEILCWFQNDECSSYKLQITPCQNMVTLCVIPETFRMMLKVIYGFPEERMRSLDFAQKLLPKCLSQCTQSRIRRRTPKKLLGNHPSSPKKLWWSNAKFGPVGSCKVCPHFIHSFQTSMLIQQKWWFIFCCLWCSSKPNQYDFLLMLPHVHKKHMISS